MLQNLNRLMKRNASILKKRNASKFEPLDEAKCFNTESLDEAKCSNDSGLKTASPRDTKAEGVC
jgi:ATP-dependent helicase/DNAse subunit B